MTTLHTCLLQASRTVAEFFIFEEHLPKRGEVGSATSMRSDPLDFLKGVLVATMVLFHAINYFVKGQPSLYIYIKFVTGGFIFVTGYIFTMIYSIKYNHNKVLGARRLAIRGLKLIGIFTILNLLIHALEIRNFNSVQFGIHQFLSHLDEIYLVVEAD